MYRCTVLHWMCIRPPHSDHRSRVVVTTDAFVWKGCTTAAAECRGFWSWAEFAKGPQWSVLRPFLKDGSALSLRIIFTLGIVMASSSVLARVNTASQAAHEILRQVWICAFQARLSPHPPSPPSAALHHAPPSLPPQ